MTGIYWHRDNLTYSTTECIPHLAQQSECLKLQHIVPSLLWMLSIKMPLTLYYSTMKICQHSSSWIWTMEEEVVGDFIERSIDKFRFLEIIYTNLFQILQLHCTHICNCLYPAAIVNPILVVCGVFKRLWSTMSEERLIGLSHHYIVRQFVINLDDIFLTSLLRNWDHLISPFEFEIAYSTTLILLSL